MALFTFLDTHDLESAIKSEHLKQITSHDGAIIPKAEKAAISMIAGNLSQRYEVADIFPKILLWSGTRAYSIPVETTVEVSEEEYTYTPRFTRDASGVITNYCYHNATWWKAVQDSTNQEPGGSIGYWIEEDPRDAQIVQYVSDVTIFFIFRRVSPRQIPDLRLSMYNEVKEWLSMVRQDQITPDLPKPLPVDDSVDDIPWGSSEAQSHYY